MKKTLFDYIQLVGILLIAVVTIMNSFGLMPDKKRAITEHIRDVELKYWGSLSDLTDEVQNYINTKSPQSNLHAYDLIEKCNEYGVDLKFTLAQAQLESNFGVIGMAARTNSVWNIGAYDGADYDKISRTFIYTHPNDAIEPYLRILKNRYLLDKTEIDLLLNFVDIDNKRYASDPQYEMKLSSIYMDITDNTRIDELQSIVRHYRIERGNK